MRLLIVKDPEVLELQEKNEDGYYLVAFWNTRELFFDADKNCFFQYQDWPSNKEVQSKTAELNAMTDKEEAKKLFEEAKADRKSRSKKVAYKVLVNNKNYADTISKYIEEGISKEFLD